MVHFCDMRDLTNPFTPEECEAILQKFADAMTDNKFYLSKTGTYPKCKCIALRRDKKVIPLWHACSLYPLRYRKGDRPACLLQEINEYPKFYMFPEFNKTFDDAIDYFNSGLYLAHMTGRFIVAYYLFDE